MKQADTLLEERDLQVSASRRARAVHTRTAVLGLLIVAGALAFVVTRLAMLGLSAAELAPIAVFLVVTLLTAGLAWRFRTWAKVLAAVVGLALLAAYLPIIIVEIRVPQSFFDFAPVFAALLGCLVAIAGGIAAVVKRRDRRVEAAASERRVAVAVLGVLGAVLALSGLLTVASRTTVAADQRAGADEVVLVDFEFDQPVYRAAAGETRFVVANQDSSWHTFTIDELGIDVMVLPGSEALVEIPASAAPGTYTLYCVPHAEDSGGERHGMVSTLEITG